MRKLLILVSGAILLLSGCAAGLIGVGFNALALGAGTAVVAKGAAEQKADRCYVEETKIIKYAQKDTPEYRRDMAKKGCPT